MRYLHLGCGSHKLPEPWENHDRDVDICRPLPYTEEVVYILAEHVIEHVPFRQGYSFLAECHRILIPGGVLRLSFPDITRISTMYATSLYAEVLRQHTKQIITSPEEVWKSMAVDWSHQSVWTCEMAVRLLSSLKFSASVREYGHSRYPELMRVDGRHLSEGIDLAMAETTVIEATKLVF